MLRKIPINLPSPFAIRFFFLGIEVKALKLWSEKRENRTSTSLTRLPFYFSHPLTIVHWGNFPASLLFECTIALYFIIFSYTHGYIIIFMSKCILRYKCYQFIPTQVVRNVTIFIQIHNKPSHFQTSKRAKKVDPHKPTMQLWKIWFVSGISGC